MRYFVQEPKIKPFNFRHLEKLNLNEHLQYEGSLPCPPNGWGASFTQRSFIMEDVIRVLTLLSLLLQLIAVIIDMMK